MPKGTIGQGIGFAECRKPQGVGSADPAWYGGRSMVEVVRQLDCKVDREQDVISVQGQPLHFQRFHYIMMNQPAGVPLRRGFPIKKTSGGSTSAGTEMSGVVSSQGGWTAIQKGYFC